MNVVAIVEDKKYSRTLELNNFIDDSLLFGKGGEGEREGGGGREGRQRERGGGREGREGGSGRGEGGRGRKGREGT